MNKQERDKIKKFSLWVPIRRYRREFRESTYKLIDKEKKQSSINTLNKYIALITPTNDKSLQRKILKDNLYQISIEISSFCNRKCWFCPNSYIDRKSKAIDLPEDIYIKIISNLQEIDYSGRLCLIRYNEPLANKNLILKRIRQARQSLPNVKIEINTNGDYINREYLDELKDAGLSYINMSFYFDKNQKFDVDKLIRPAIDKMADKLRLQYEIAQDSIYAYRVKFIYDGIDIICGSWNPETVGINRGGAITDNKIKQAERDYGCYAPLANIDISYDGLVMPCCNVRSDIESHKNYIMGDMRDNDLFELFMNDKFINMRKILTNDSLKHGACQYCNMNTEHMWQPYAL